MDSTDSLEGPDGSAATAVQTILLLNGPNLDMLGVRQPQTYGSSTLIDVETLAGDTAAELGLVLHARQTNHEGEMIDWVHGACGTVGAIVINPGGWTHTSVALRDALVIPEVPVIEVHISNIAAREEFRHHSYISPIAAAVIAGCGIQGYEFAVRRAAALLSV